MNSISRFFASLAYIGYFPKAPGTIASFISLLIIVYFDINKELILIIIAVLVGILVSNEVEKTDGKDPSHIVIDEFAGILISFYYIDLSLFNIIIGFALFRFFDIIKPLGIRCTQSLKGGIGVMIDDIIAGIYTNGSIHLINYLWISYK